MNNFCTLKDAVSPWLTATYRGIEKYLALGTKVSLKKGEVLISPGVRCTDLFFIVEGHLRISLVNYGGQEKLIAIMNKGGIIYEGSPMGNNSTPVFIKTLEKSHLVKFSEAQLKSIMEEDQQVALDLINYLHLKYKMLLSLYQGLLFCTPPQRLCRLFCLLGDSFGEKTENNFIIHLRLTQSQLAELLGLSRVTVATILKDMKQKDIVEIRNKTYFFSPEICSYCQDN